MERQNEYKCAFSAFLKQAEEIPSIPTVPQAYGKYLTLKIQRNAAQQGQQAEGKTNTMKICYWRKNIEWYNFPWWNLELDNVLILVRFLT